MSGQKAVYILRAANKQTLVRSHLLVRGCMKLVGTFFLNTPIFKIMKTDFQEELARFLETTI